MNVTVVDYDAGNLRSVELALEHLGATYSVTHDPGLVRSSHAILFPGVGDGAHAMSVLRERGLDAAMTAAFAAGIPILGICVGCQIALDRTEEGDAECLHLIPGATRRFEPMEGLKIPHMGWNSVHHEVGHWLFDGIRQEASFYFVHSYYPAPEDPSVAVAWARYGHRFATAVELGSLVAVQFHPEKSGRAGLTLLRNFLVRSGAIRAGGPGG
jgi:glutamine amidotransferase